MTLFTKARARRAAWAIAALALGASRASAALFTPGDLIVSCYGASGAGLAQGAPAPIYLIEYAPSGGAPVLTDVLPMANNVGASGNLGVVGQYGSASEGNIQLSGDGQYLTFAAYSASAAAAGIQASTNTANGTNFTIGSKFSHSSVSLAQSTDTNVPRVGVLIDSNGNINSTTELNDVYNTNNPRALYSANGATFYISGQGDGNDSDQGIFHGSVGLNTVTSPGSSPTGIYNAHDTRFVTAFNNNLLYSIDTSSGNYTGIWQFNGMPSGSSSAAQIIPGNNGQSSNKVYYSPDGFFFANADTLYVADTGQPKAGGAGAVGDGGIQKWTYNGSTWSLQYTLTPDTSTWIPNGDLHPPSTGETGFAAITGQVVGSGPSQTVDLYAVSDTIGGEDPDGLYAITDTIDATTPGPDETFDEIEMAGGDGGQIFKGVSFAPVALPEPTSVAFLPLTALALLSRRNFQKFSSCFRRPDEL